MYDSLKDLPASVRNQSIADQVRWRAGHNAALRKGKTRKDAPGMGQVHVDSIAWQKPKKKPTVTKGRILKEAEAQRYTLGVVYEPDTEDSQGDFASAQEIEQACRDFNRRQIGTGVSKGALGIQHQDWDDGNGEIIESYIAPCPMQIGGQQIKPGTWLMGVIWSPANWEKIQNGAVTGLSMGGQARREDA